MKPEKFEILCKEFVSCEEQLMGWKAGEHSCGIDRLQNFREVAEFLESTPADVAFVYMMKHIQSLSVALKTNTKEKWCWQIEGKEGLKQRIADARNYLLLLAACLDEEQDESSD